MERNVCIPFVSECRYFFGVVLIVRPLLYTIYTSTHLSTLPTLNQLLKYTYYTYTMILLYFMRHTPMRRRLVTDCSSSYNVRLRSTHIDVTTYYIILYFRIRPVQAAAAAAAAEVALRL